MQNKEPQRETPAQPLDAQRQTPDQSPEDTLNRIAGVPKTAEELEAERQQLDQERNAPTNQPNNRTTAQPNQTHAEQERERQREKS
jgi:hypothetical protein